MSNFKIQRPSACSTIPSIISGYLLVTDWFHPGEKGKLNPTVEESGGQGTEAAPLAFREVNAIDA